MSGTECFMFNFRQLITFSAYSVQLIRNSFINNNNNNNKKKKLHTSNTDPLDRSNCLTTCIGMHKTETKATHHPAIPVASFRAYAVIICTKKHFKSIWLEKSGEIIHINFRAISCAYENDRQLIAQDHIYQ